eukprot:TRINITY_DN21950_c0_g1_i2.p1 TRINITY_DN21950_c0_g1~~TRINITY_DN21950_c0_g1_i2.p1  ORF type:complete len:964 (+),score=277.44 TRINITY_DN21950_c0_g1_i2:115-2892(+)
MTEGPAVARRAVSARRALAFAAGAGGDGAATEGASASAGAQRRSLSKRRQRSEGQLQRVLHEVSESLTSTAAEETDGPLKAFGGLGGTALGAAAQSRRSVSLRLPRPGSTGSPTGGAGTLEHLGAKVLASTPSTTSTNTGGWQSVSSNGGGDTITIAGDGATPAAPAGVATGPGLSSDMNHRELLDQLEDLRLQNAILRKSLATLQQSVVESMKGNRAQFVGNGFFRQQGGSSNADVPGRGRSQSVSLAPVLPDGALEDLRAALNERKAALRAALAERDEALRRAEAVEATLAKERLEAAAEARRRDALLEEGAAARARAEDELRAAEAMKAELESRLARLTAEAEEARRAGGEAERLAREAQAQVVALEADYDARATRLSAELEEAQQAREAAAKEADNLRQRLRALEARCSTAEEEVTRLTSAGSELEAEIVRLRAITSSDESRLARLYEERRVRALRTLSAAFGTAVPLDVCFAAWRSILPLAREARLRERVRELEADVARLQEELRGVREATETGREEAQAAAQRLAAAEAAAAAAESRAREAEAKAAAASLDTGAADAANKRLKEAEEELGALRGKADAAAEEAKAARAEAELEASGRRSAEAAATEAKEAQKRAATEAEQKQRKTQEELAKSRAEARKKAQDVQAAEKRLLESEASARGFREEAQDARRRAEEADGLAHAMSAKVEELQRNASAMEGAEAQRCEETRQQLEREAARVAEAQASLLKLQEDREGLHRDRDALNANVERLKLDLAEARSAAKSATERLKLSGDKSADVLRLLEDEKAARAKAESRIEALESGDADLREQARQAVEAARTRVRIMVAAPKVAINIGGNEHQVVAPFPLSAIKDVVRDEVVPKFSKAMAVAEGLGDAEVREKVQLMVQEMALTLQKKVYELLPKAEGTCNWDGFGAKADNLSM